MHQLPDQGNAESSMIYGASELPNTGSLGDQISLAEIVRCCLWNILMNWERDTSWSDPLFRPEKLPDASWHPFKPLVPIYLWVKNHGGHQNSFGCSCPPSIPIPSMTFQTGHKKWSCNHLLDIATSLQVGPDLSSITSCPLATTCPDTTAVFIEFLLGSSVSKKKWKGSSAEAIENI